MWHFAVLYTVNVMTSYNFVYISYFCENVYVYFLALFLFSIPLCYCPCNIVAASLQVMCQRSQSFVPAVRSSSHFTVGGPSLMPKCKRYRAKL
jgi:hypothetical protein